LPGVRVGKARLEVTQAAIDFRVGRFALDQQHGPFPFYEHEIHFAAIGVAELLLP
jgi:hypothetical protein